MSLEFRPFGTRCNIKCEYCYEQATRDAGHLPEYDRDKVWPVLSSATEYWGLFGGEALLLSLPDLEELLALSFEKFKQSGVQTNGSLIREAHLALFEQYHTHVGISIDGPGDLNDIRWAGTEAGTRKMTARTEAAIEALCSRAAATGRPHLTPSLIVTLHDGNIGTPEKRARMMAWFRDLDAMGIEHVNLHEMELDYRAARWALSDDVGLQFLLDLWDQASTFRSLRFKKFEEILTLLKGSSTDTTCVWHACDPWNTQAVQGLDGDGTPGGCTRTCKDGKTWLPAIGSGTPTRHALGGLQGNRHHERQLSLYVTPQEHGGCKDCRFWLMCQGQCPGTGVATGAMSTGDWRQRSASCAMWIGLFEEGERRLLAIDEVPVSRRADRLAREHRQYAMWVNGAPASQDVIQHGHGDTPHQDRHGDHDDAAQLSRTVAR